MKKLFCCIPGNPGHPPASLPHFSSILAKSSYMPLITQGRGILGVTCCSSVKVGNKFLESFVTARPGGGCCRTEWMTTAGVQTDFTPGL